MTHQMPNRPARPLTRRIGMPGVAAIATFLLIAGVNLPRLEWGPPRYEGVLINEYWHVAAAWTDGRGFADPFGMASGPTAWVPPLLVWIYSLLVLVFPGQAAAFLAAGCLKAGGYALSAWLWSDLVRRRAGHGAAVCFLFVWLAFLAPTQRLHLSLELHDPWLVGLLLVFTLWSFDRLRRRRDGRWSLAAAFALGPLAGPIVAFTQLGLAATRLAVWACPSRPFRWRAAARALAPALAAFFLVGAAWSLRCRMSMGAWIPIKSNGAYEAWQAQCATEDGVPSYGTFFDHPFLSDTEAARFVREGELAYVRRHGEVFFRALREAPGDFVRRVGHRAFNALVWMRSPADNVTVEKRADIRALMPALRDTGLARETGGPGGWTWVRISRSPEECWRLLAEAPGLDEKARLLLFGAWSRAHEALERHRASVSERVRGFAMAGLPFGAALGLLLLDRVGRRASEASFWAAAYGVYLAPYILISHYERYQVPLAGLQAVLTAVLIWRLVERTRRDRVIAPSARSGESV